MKWLVTAFEPFAGAQTNSSQIALKGLQSLDWQGQVEFFDRVPVQFTTAWTVVRGVLARFPDVDGVLALGQAEKRDKISLEKVAVNWVDASGPDNSGFKPGQSRIEKGPDAIFTNVAWEKFELSPMVKRSYTAGTYVCNTLLYQMLNAGLEKKMAFVHVPALQSQTEAAFADCPRMRDEDAVRELERIVRFVVSL